MGLTSDDAINWTAEAQGDRTVVAQHPDGHRVVFGFSADGENEIHRQSETWASDGDHLAHVKAAAVAARIVARAKGWLY